MNFFVVVDVDRVVDVVDIFEPLDEFDDDVVMYVDVRVVYVGTGVVTGIGYGLIKTNIKKISACKNSINIVKLTNQSFSARRIRFLKNKKIHMTNINDTVILRRMI